MSLEPTGIVTTTAAATRELVLTRQFDSPIEDVWASLTDSERTAKWFGAYTRSGDTVAITMGFETDSPVAEAHLDTCEAPHHLVLSFLGDYAWSVDVKLTEHAGATTMVFTQPLPDPSQAENIGPGWEWYLDVLLASREDAPLPSFDDYYPAQAAYYAAQV